MAGGTFVHRLLPLKKQDSKKRQYSQASVIYDN